MDKDIFTLKHLNKCPVCDSDQHNYLGFRGGDSQRDGLGIETKISQCLNCTVIFPNPFPLPISHDAIYADAHEYFPDNAEEDWQMRAKEYEKIVEKFIKLIGSRERVSLLDIGAGRGEFVQAASAFPEVDCVGVELSHDFIDFAAERGVELEDTMLNELIQKGQLFDGICLNAVIEHVHEPSIFIKEVSMLLKKDGILFIDCPNEPNLLTIIGNLASKILGSDTVYNLSPTWEPFHVFGFNPKALTILLNNNSIDISEMRIAGSNSVPYSGGGFKNYIKSIAGSMVLRLSNILNMGDNLYAWCKKR